MAKMSAKPNESTQQLCIVVPVYRHVAPFGDYLQKLLPYSLPIIVVDDGNCPKDAQSLEEFISAVVQSADVTLLRHGQNLGKGAAVLSAMSEAKRRGYTHALQIDADGQHCADDIEVFARACRANPQSLILGSPRFDSSAPKSRVWGRKLTNLMVILESWSLSVSDGLFGFRIYPVNEVCDLCSQHKLSPRMGFDVEILIRLLWRGLSVVNIESQVQYPKGGFSNFRYVHDNLKFILLHTRLLLCGLVLGPLGRIYALGRPKTTKWFEKKERGTRTALKLLLFLYRLGGRPLLEFLLHPVMIYFYWTDPLARRASREYLKQLKSFAPEADIPRFIPSYWHLHRFGLKVISSLQAWMGEFRGRDLYWEGKEKVFALVDQGVGGIVISAHVGCLDMCRATHKDRKGLTINPLMHMKAALQFRTFLSELNPKSSVEVVAVEEFHAGVGFQIKERIDQGEFFAILADRQAPGSPGRTMDVSFLGRTAQLPEGPFALAMALDCPVFTFFTAYNEKTKRYEAFWQDFSVKRPAARKERRAAIEAMANEYVRRLEEICVENPLQWFNFYHYWDQQD